MTDAKAPRNWRIQEATDILDSYKLPSANIDIGNVYFAATQFEGAYQELRDKATALRAQNDASYGKSVVELSHKVLELEAKAAGLEAEVDKIRITATEYWLGWSDDKVRIERLEAALKLSEDAIKFWGAQDPVGVSEVLGEIDRACREALKDPGNGGGGG